jgi:hypothetical protein
MAFWEPIEALIPQCSRRSSPKRSAFPFLGSGFGLRPLKRDTQQKFPLILIAHLRAKGT